MKALKVHRATVLQDGHVDHITGPRCIVKMEGGPRFGKYIIVHTEKVLTKDTPVLVDYRRHASVVIPA